MGLTESYVAVVGTLSAMASALPAGATTIQRARSTALVFVVLPRRRRSVFCFLNSNSRGSRGRAPLPGKNVGRAYFNN